MKADAIITLTTGTDYANVSISEENILFVQTLGGAVNVCYSIQGAFPKLLVANETAANIALQSNNLLTVTDLATGGTLYINANRINRFVANGADSDIYFDSEGATPTKFTIDQSVTALAELIYAKADVTVYTIDGGSASAKEFEIAAAEGDVTAAFAAGKAFQVIGGDAGNASIYTVASSSHSGNTTVVVVEVVNVDPTVGRAVIGGN
jgi:hypothetical protein